MKSTLASRRRLNPSTWVLAMHVPLAAFVALHDYPATQDGPSHLYGVHVLRSLATDVDSPFRAIFSANLRPGTNSLFTYLALGVARFANEDWAVRLCWLFALVGMPLGALAFERSLREERGTNGERNPTLTVPLACVLAYNYFLYRGLFNYVLGVPLAMGCLAAVVASGHFSITRLRGAAYTAIALVCAWLAALAHPAAILFLLVAIPAACIPAWRRRGIAGAFVCLLLVWFVYSTWTPSERPPPPEFVNPVIALSQFVRAIGITYSWLEVLPAGAILLLCGLGVVRSLRNGASKSKNFATHFPVWLALALVLVYFFVPFSYGGGAGINERIPIFAVLLVLPYTSISARRRAWVPVLFVPFAAYTLIQNIHVNALANQVRHSIAGSAIPRGSRVSLDSLRVKYGTLSADLGRHLLGDLARTSGLVSGSVFCGHPAHIVRCTSRTPGMPDLSGIQDFEHLSPERRRAALADPQSSIVRSLDSMRQRAEEAQYLLVLHAAELDDAYDERVIRRLHAVRIDTIGGIVSAYRVPHPVDGKYLASAGNIP